MNRTICPQMKGIYLNNEPQSHRYPYLLIPENNPDMEYYAIDAYECNRNGNIHPRKECAEPHLANDFGKFISSLME